MMLATNCLRSFAQSLLIVLKFIPYDLVHCAPIRSTNSMASFIKGAEVRELHDNAIGIAKLLTAITWLMQLHFLQVSAEFNDSQLVLTQLLVTASYKEIHRQNAFAACPTRVPHQSANVL